MQLTNFYVEEETSQKCKELLPKDIPFAALIRALLEYFLVTPELREYFLVQAEHSVVKGKRGNSKM